MIHWDIIKSWFDVVGFLLSVLPTILVAIVMTLGPVVIGFIVIMTVIEKICWRLRK